MIDWTDPHYKISKYFTVAEVTQNDDRRIPLARSEAERNIVALAKELDQVRDSWGSAILVTSWYRPPAINRAVGGVSNSQHIYGAAADIYPANGNDLVFEQWLDRKWGGALGYGQSSGRGFTHVDLRGGGYEHGSGSIRWDY